MDYPYKQDKMSAGEAFGMALVIVMLFCLVLTIAYFVLNPSKYEYEKDGETQSADYCYTGKADEFICEVDGRRFHVDTYRKYREQ